jgi:thiosulfate/3-mercaptopyruvate sulfurtransferase
MPHTTLVSTQDLFDNLSDPNWVVFDCRHDLMDVQAGRRAWDSEHIPGARFAHLDENLSGPKTGRSGRHPLPDATALARWLGAGIYPRQKLFERCAFCLGFRR